MAVEGISSTVYHSRITATSMATMGWAVICSRDHTQTTGFLGLHHTCGLGKETKTSWVIWITPDAAFRILASSERVVSLSSLHISIPTPISASGRTTSNPTAISMLYPIPIPTIVNDMVMSRVSTSSISRLRSMPCITSTMVEPWPSPVARSIQRTVFVAIPDRIGHRIVPVSVRACPELWRGRSTVLVSVLDLLAASVV